MILKILPSPSLLTTLYFAKLMGHSIERENPLPISFEYLEISVVKHSANNVIDVANNNMNIYVFL